MKFFNLNNNLIAEKRFHSILNSIKFLFDRNNIVKHKLPGLESSINSNLEFIGFTILDYSIMSLIKKSHDNSFKLHESIKIILNYLNLIDSKETIADDVKAISSQIINFLPIEHDGELVSMPVLGMLPDIQAVEI